MIFVQAIRDRYTASSAAADTAEGRGVATENFIRRPTNGIQIKDDTFATIRVVAADGGGNKLLVDAGSRRKDSDGLVLEIDGKSATDIYSNFLLQQVQEERMEKQQVLETFGEAYIFLFGQRARVITFQGILANTFDFNWEAEWWHNYDNYLRGTKCVENDARVYISYDNTLVGGYVISTSSAKDSMNKNHVSFTFQLFVTYYSNFSNVGNPSAYNGRAGSNETTLTSEQLAQFRPTLIPSKIPISSNPLIGEQATTLFAALEANVAKAKNAWSQATDVVNNTLNSVVGLFNIDSGVRVPIGWEGSAIFNDEPFVPATVNEKSGRISFTTFSDNVAEYVGVSDHYGGASNPSGANRFNFGASLTYAQEMVNSAVNLWAKDGKFVVPPDQLGPVSKFLVSKALGLAAVGATAAWKGASTALQAGSADAAHFAASLAASAPSE